MKARWVQLQQHNGFQAPGSIGGSSQTWAVVDESDEIIATVGGAGQWWSASEMYRGTGSSLSHSTRSGTFISEEAGKKAVEGWLSATHQFYDPNANAWVYRVAP